MRNSAPKNIATPSVYIRKPSTSARSWPPCGATGAAAYFMVGEYGQAVKDSGHAVELDPAYGKAHVRRSRSFVQLGDFDAAVSGLLHSLDFDHSSDSNQDADGDQRPPAVAVLSSSAKDSMVAELDRALHFQAQFDQGKSFMKATEYARARPIFAQILAEVQAAPLMLWAARAELGLGFCDRALHLSLRVTA